MDHIEEMLHQPSYDFPYNIDQDPVWNSEATPKPFENLGWYQCNHLGTPTEISDSSSEIIWQATFTTAGNETANSKNAIIFADNQHPTSQIRFQGQYFDTETNLHYNRYRYYDPLIGRFIGKDPIGLSGGINIYNYGPNPVEWVDPLGLWGENPKFKYRQNENGTLRSVVAQIRDSDLDTGTDTNRSARRYIQSIGCGGDHAGHAIANRLGGRGRKGNVFPQNGNINTGQFRIFEENIYHQAKNPENNVIVRITPQYERGETRPHSILYQARVNGVTQRQEFPNPCGCPCL